jgi:RNA polymerase sigma-54 factor
MPRLKLRQSLRQILTPQQVIQASILQLNVSNLEQKVLDELESNPVLEQAETQDDEEVINSENEEVDFEEDPDEYEPANIYDNTRKENRELPVREQLDFAEGLVKQLDNFNLSDLERAIAEDILWNLDENGYLAVDPILIADRYDRKEEEVKHVQDKLQQLEPPGIAAKDLLKTDDMQEHILRKELLKRVTEDNSFEKTEYILRVLIGSDAPNAIFPGPVEE